MKLTNMKLSSLKEPTLPLRGNEITKELIASVKTHGVVNPLLVRSGTLEIVKGVQRYHAAKAAGIKSVPVNLIECTDREMIEIQLMMSQVRVPVKPYNVKLHITRLLAVEPTLTMSQLADRISTPRKVIHKLLALSNLATALQKIVINNAMCLANAYALTKLPEARQLKLDYKLPSVEFLPLVSMELSNMKRKV